MNLNLALAGLAATPEQVANIKTIYATLLGREPDAEWEAKWELMFDQGWSPEEIERVIKGWPEYQQHVAAVVAEQTGQSVLTPQNIGTTGQILPQTIPLGAQTGAGGISSKTLMFAGLAVGALLLVKK